MSIQAYKYVLLNILGVALFMASWVVGWIPKIIIADKSGLTIAIVVLTAVSVGCVAAEKNKLSIWIGAHLTLIGLIGTVVGFMMSTDGIDLTGGLERSVEEAGSILGGIATAFGTTLFGLVGYVWVKLNHLIVNADYDA